MMDQETYIRKSVHVIIVAQIRSYCTLKLYIGDPPVLSLAHNFWALIFLKKNFYSIRLNAVIILEGQEVTSKILDCENINYKI